jgi:hypothetical protein
MPFLFCSSHRVPVHLAAHDSAPLLPRRSPATCLRFWLLVTLLVLSRGSAYADWVAIEKEYQSPGLRTVYIDSATIHREGHLVTVVSLVDWKSMQGHRFHRFMSTKTHKQFDCGAKRLRLLAFTEFSRHMGTGRPAKGYVDPDNWLPVKRESIDQGLWEVACGKE